MLMRPQNSLFGPPGVALVLLLLALPLNATEQQPIDVLREQVEAGISVLNRGGDPATQQNALCAIAHEMFDAYAFSRLVLAGNWPSFNAEQQQTFVNVFSEFLCRYYLSRLQAHYSQQQVKFSDQTFKSDTRATVTATVAWQDLDVAVEVRMARREGRWRAYDIVIAGISAVMLYRTQFAAALLQSSPDEVIAELRRRIREQG